jgi:hypothetical protein
VSPSLSRLIQFLSVSSGNFIFSSKKWGAGFAVPPPRSGATCLASLVVAAGDR